MGSSVESEMWQSNVNIKEKRSIYTNTLSSKNELDSNGRTGRELIINCGRD